jgi:Arc/MetJ-type ribon-helix-helix transcriptional regulator
VKTVKIELPDEDAAALERAATDGGFASSSELVLAAIGDLIAVPVAYDPDALVRDVAEHQAAKRRGDVGLRSEEARAWLKANRSA